jgi:DNA-binding phage protein
MCDDVIHESRRYSRRDMALMTAHSLREVFRLLLRQVAATPQAIARLQPAINDLEKEKQETAETLSKARQASQKIGLRKFAAQAGIDPANLYKTLTAKRRPSVETLAKLQQILTISECSGGIPSAQPPNSPPALNPIPYTAPLNGSGDEQDCCRDPRLRGDAYFR